MAAPKIRYQQDAAAFNEVMNAAPMLALMEEAAEKGKAYAITIAPKETGHYAESFEVEVHSHGGPQGNRAEAILSNTASYAADVEWRNHHGEHVLGRTVDFIESEYR